MYRIILILGLLVVLYFLIRRAVRALKGPGEPDGLLPDKDHMVQDPVCLVFVPREAAITQDIGGRSIISVANPAHTNFRKNLPVNSLSNWSRTAFLLCRI